MPEETTPATTTTSTDDAVATTTTGATTGETPTTQASTDDSKPSLETLPKYWQDHIKDLRSENKSKREAAQTAEREAKAREEADLAARQEWEKLAKSREQEVAELKPKAEDAAKLNEILAEQINREIEKWPEEVKATAPDGEVSALELVAWMDKMRPLAQKLLSATNTATTPTPGNGPGPNPRTQTTQRPAGSEGEPVIDVSRRF